MEKGPRGPRGYRGKDGSLTELCTWLPESVIYNLRKNEDSGAFFIAGFYFIQFCYVNILI